MPPVSQKVSITPAQRRLRLRLAQPAGIKPAVSAPISAEPTAGVYAAVYLDFASQTALAKWAREIINPALPAGTEPLEPTEYHTTVVYSRNPFEYLGHGVFEPLAVDEKPYRLDSFGKPDGPKHLVLCFSCATLTAWNTAAMAAGASSDFPTYQPHITLAKNLPADYNYQGLPVYAGPLVFRFEEVKPLQDD